MSRKEIHVNEANQRFDRFLRKYFKHEAEVTLADIYSWIRKWAIKVNGKKKEENYKLVLGDVVEFAEEKLTLKQPFVAHAEKTLKKHNISIDDIKKQIVYEDDHWIFWNKPYGIVIHPGNLHLNDITLNDYLETYVHWSWKQEGKDPQKMGITFKPSFGFRLDKDTSGLIVGAKDYEALQYLNEIIRDRKVSKKYLAVVKGKAPAHMIINKPIFKGFNATEERAQMFVDMEKGLESKTEFECISTISNPHIGEISLLLVTLHTGRMHQIRVHLASENLPIVGDIIYGDEKLNDIAYRKEKVSRQLLHSYGYGFYDCFSQKNLYIQTDIPHDLKKLFPEIQTINPVILPKKK